MCHRKFWFQGTGTADLRAMGHNKMPERLEAATEQLLANEDEPTEQSLQTAAPSSVRATCTAQPDDELAEIYLHGHWHHVLRCHVDEIFESIDSDQDRIEWMDW